MDHIILAGGLGTRLRSSIGDQPKAMAEVNGRPFLYYLFRYLESQRCTRVILSLGYKSEAILDWIAATAWAFEIGHVIEKEPLGTGGGIQLAMLQAQTDTVAVLNGDTLFLAASASLLSFHQARNAECTLALKPMTNFDRYGSVRTNETGGIIAFEEKAYREQGLINCGSYLIDRARFLNRTLPERFSFEKDYLEAFVAEGRFYGLSQDAYFIDIGIPEDYARAQQDFKTIFG